MPPHKPRNPFNAQRPQLKTLPNLRRLHFPLALPHPQSLSGRHFSRTALPPVPSDVDSRVHHGLLPTSHTVYHAYFTDTPGNIVVVGSVVFVFSCMTVYGIIDHLVNTSNVIVGSLHYYWLNPLKYFVDRVSSILGTWTCRGCISFIIG